MKLPSHNVTETWYFLTVVPLCGSFCFHSNAVHCRVFLILSQIILELHIELLEVVTTEFFFTYHISWDKCSQKPQNLACWSESIHNPKKKCGNITGPPTVSKAMQPRKIGKEMKHWDVPSSSQLPCYLWINLTKPHAWGSSLEKKVITLPA